MTVSPQAPASAVTAASPPANRAERLLIPATFITCLGNSIQIIAASLLVVQAEQTAMSVGWLFIAVAAPQALLSVWFGRLADRFDRRMLCLVCDLLSAAGAVALPVWLLLGGPTDTAVYATNLALATVSALFIPASNALVKERVHPERLGKFNARFEVATQAGTLLSTGIGGMLVQLFGAKPLFFFNGLTFLLSAVCWIFVGRKPMAAAAQDVAGGDDVSVAEASPVVRLGLLYAIGNIIVTVSNALVVVLVVQAFKQGAGVLGVVDALAGVGVVIAAAVYGKLSGRLGELHLMLLGYLGCALFITLQPRFGTIGLMMLLPLGALTFGLARISARTLLMKATTEDRAGSVFGATNAFGLAASAGAALAITMLSDHTHVKYGYLSLGVLVAVVASITIGSVRRLYGKQSTGTFAS
ncbi:MFS transporter [Streptomyces sp. NBC_01217]|uniref:MFS transporter n=1 Tax=Streptomyces sp. NBC_01217 TaxID=2903779 RepID=UPI002E14A067|nr:MFS transporter [Streptomyces sp. NBC_01217]